MADVLVNLRPSVPGDTETAELAAELLAAVGELGYDAGIGDEPIVGRGSGLSWTLVLSWVGEDVAPHRQRNLPHRSPGVSWSSSGVAADIRPAFWSCTALTAKRSFPGSKCTTMTTRRSAASSGGDRRPDVSARRQTVGQ